MDQSVERLKAFAIREKIFVWGLLLCIAYCAITASARYRWSGESSFSAVVDVFLILYLASCLTWKGWRAFAAWLFSLVFLQEAWFTYNRYLDLQQKPPVLLKYYADELAGDEQMMLVVNVIFSVAILILATLKYLRDRKDFSTQHQAIGKP